MMRMIITILAMLGCLLLTDCKSYLVGDIYRYTARGTDEEALTAFITLSNIALKKEEIALIVADYNDEQDKQRKFLYEYLLAKSTHEKKYIDSFVAHCVDNIPFLSENNSRWVAASSPFYELLADYALNNDKALLVLFRLVKEADGGPLSVVADNLAQIYKMNPQRFSLLAKKSGTQLSDIQKLMEQNYQSQQK
jgi:hypothetical protein